MGDGRASQCKAGEKRQVDGRLQRGQQGNARHGEACEEWVLPAGRDGGGGATASSMVGMWRGVLVCGRCVWGCVCVCAAECRVSAGVCVRIRGFCARCCAGGSRPTAKKVWE